MSGGSFDYLCFKDCEISYLVEQMSAALREYPAGELAADDTDALTVKDFNSDAHKPLRIVWQAVEWHHSGDYGASQVDSALNEYNRQREIARRIAS